MNPHEWEYLAEGGANIVFRYIGTDNNYVNKVLRVRKKDNESAENYSFVSLIPGYYKVLCHFLHSDEYSDKISCIKLPKDFIESLNTFSFSKRPEHRRSKAELDKSITEALLLPDLHLGKVSCEIKPKWSGLSHSHGQNEICSCRYCLAQVSKGRRIKVNKSNVYCPKLLFSNNTTEISTALSDLFDNPSNQLKVFIDSKMITSENLKPLSQKFIDILTRIIATDSVFSHFLRVQCQLLEGVSLEMQTSTIDDEKYRLDIQRLSEMNTISVEIIPDYLRILMAMSIRDSSFIISFKLGGSESEWKQIKVDEQIYSYIIDFIDLDIKPLSKLEKYIKEIKIHG